MDREPTRTVSTTLVQSHALLLDEANPNAGKRTHNTCSSIERGIAPRLIHRHMFLLLDQIEASWPASFPAIEICSVGLAISFQGCLRTVRADVLLVDSGSDQRMGIQPGSRSLLSIRDSTQGPGENRNACFKLSRLKAWGQLCDYMGSASDISKGSNHIYIHDFPSSIPGSM